MNRLPIRAVFMLKDRRRRVHRDAEPIASNEEIMCMLRCVPGEKSIARAARALDRHYKFEAIPQEPHSFPTPELLGFKVIHFELTSRKGCMGFEQACKKAIESMRLYPAGFPHAIGMVYPKRPAFSYSQMEQLSLQEKIEWFQERMRETLVATSCALERQSLCVSCQGHTDASIAVKSSWL